MTQHGMAALALASSGGDHHRHGIAIVVLVIIIAVIAFFLIKWARSRRDHGSGMGGN